MNIKTVQNIAKAYSDQTKLTKSAKNQSTRSSQQPDEVILSSQAQEVSQQLRTLKNVPEVRVDRVQELSEQIASGSYNVNSRELAERIIAYSKNERLL